MAIAICGAGLVMVPTRATATAPDSARLMDQRGAEPPSPSIADIASIGLGVLVLDRPAPPARRCRWRYRSEPAAIVGSANRSAFPKFSDHIGILLDPHPEFPIGVADALRMKVRSPFRPRV